MKAVHSTVLAVAGSLLGACGSPPAPESPPPPAPAPAPAAVETTRSSEVPSPAEGQAAAKSSAAPGTDVASVSLANPLGEARARETIALTLADVAKIVPGLAADKLFVVDAAGTPVLSQLVDMDGDLAPDQIVFQVDLAANGSKTVKLRVGERPTAVAADYKVYGRFVRERYDDFAWENDWVAYRMYGPALETCKNDPLTSSGIDVWVKRVRRLVVNEWYMTDNYHKDHGDGLDAYKVGPSRGCGGTGLWTGKKLAVSKNFTTSRVLANGPIRLVFELSFAPWAAGPARVSETKRVILDAGSLFNHMASTFSGRAPLSLGIGIAKHPGAAVEFDPKSAWMRDWEPLDEGKAGNVGCAIVVPPGTTAAQQQTDSEYLAVLPAKGGVPADYYVGTAWDRGGRVADLAGWKREVESLSRRLAAPVQVTLAAMPSQ
ncbi:MAG: DUF4861 domain-containing protein [Polyangiaceae bacterium]|nr:DUF4861 domain-containing protein [Polyangiaceae bacterium]